MPGPNHDRYDGPPPTIAFLRDENGVTAARISCVDCTRTVVVNFDAIGLPDDTPFPSIATRRKWVCARCQGRIVEVMPDWPTVSGQGR